MLLNVIRRQKLELAYRRLSTVLGIETSCDDTAVSIVNSARNVLSSITFTDRGSQVQKGGICPSTVAQQHRVNLPKVFNECFLKSGLSWDEITAIAVTTTPGLVIALKEGIKTGISLAKKYKKPLIPIHHMRAHALAAFLVSRELEFPFLAVLISGGHSLFVLAEDVDTFKLLGSSLSGSPGECLDKVARELKIPEDSRFQGIHPGAAMEILASQASETGHLKYKIKGPAVPGADMNFSELKSSFIGCLLRAQSDETFSLEEFCSFTQYEITRHICTRFNVVLNGLQNLNKLNLKHVVVGGGVAANKYITNGISKLSTAYGLSTILIPNRLCTDNAEMIALTGLLKLENQSQDILQCKDIPEMIYAHARSDIGEDVRHWLPKKPSRFLGGPSLHGEKEIYLYISPMAAGAAKAVHAGLVLANIKGK